MEDGLELILQTEAAGVATGGIEMVATRVASVRIDLLGLAGVLILQARREMVAKGFAERRPQPIG